MVKQSDQFYVCMCNHGKWQTCETNFQLLKTTLCWYIGFLPKIVGISRPCRDTSWANDIFAEFPGKIETVGRPVGYASTDRYDYQKVR